MNVKKIKIKSLAVIGAGASGLCAIKNAINYGVETIIGFEQSNEIGGTWVYHEQTGKDKYGIDIHSSMYQGLHTNLPKEIMHYPDFPFPTTSQSYLRAEDVLKYYQSYADTFNLRNYIKFEHHVLRVRPIAQNNGTSDEIWEVIVKDLKHDKFSTLHFDAVLVCNGHYNSPYIPDFQNTRNLFQGRQFHSHDYRNPDSFYNENILVIGAGPSARDVLLDLQKVAAKITWSHHLKDLPCTKFCDNVSQKSDVLKLTQDGAIFIDGSYQKFSVIFYCTGYQYTLPFLSIDCGLSAEDNFVNGLYKQCLSINHPSMAIIGLPNFVCPNQMFDLQVRFCLTFMTGRKKLPTKDEMLEDLKTDKRIQFVERGLPKKKFHYMGVGFHDKYYEALAKTADVEPIKPVIIKMFEKGLCLSLFDYEAFRNEAFKVIDDENFVIVSCNQ